MMYYIYNSEVKGSHIWVVACKLVYYYFQGLQPMNLVKITYYILQAIKKPEELYEAVVEVDERLILYRDDCQLNKSCPVVMGTTSEKVRAIV